MTRRDDTAPRAQEGGSYFIGKAGGKPERREFTRGPRDPEHVRNRRPVAATDTPPASPPPRSRRGKPSSEPGQEA